MKNIVALILAAGRGTRMKSEIPKVLHEILGRPMISYVADSVKSAGIEETITVIGYGNGLLKEALKDMKVVIQKELLGSADAVKAAKPVLEKFSGDVLVICGDTPLIRKETIKKLMEKHKDSGASATILTAELKDPTGYGRIVRDAGKKVIKIVEDIEAGIYEKVIEEVNVGTYCFKIRDLFEALPEVKPSKEKKEYFLTDVIGILHDKKKTIESVTTESTDEMIGINNRVDLASATRIMNQRILEELMLNGVTIQDPFSTTIYPGVKIGKDTIIHPNTLIQSNVEIGSNCHIGPFTRIRPDVYIEDRVEVGNFVELVRTRIGEGSKVKHHTYLGDTVVGKRVNVGAGTITANFDGKKKNKTVIEDEAFIGVGAIFIAPVRIGKGALVGAGSVVLRDHDVPKGATVVGVPGRILKKTKKKE